MSDITNETKQTLEGVIRHARPVSLLPLGIATVAAFAFMKAVVIAHSNTEGRKLFSPALRRRFFSSLDIPQGVQIWLAWYRGRHMFAGQVLFGKLTLRSGPFRGFQIGVFTYMVGYLVLQLTYPRWTKTTRSRKPAVPVLSQDPAFDCASIPLWPANETGIPWPPSRYLDGDSLKTFHDRWGTIPLVYGPTPPATPG
jgi:hypothetical protein